MASEKVAESVILNTNTVNHHIQGGARGPLSDGFTQLLSSLTSRPKTSQGTDRQLEPSPHLQPDTKSRDADVIRDKPLDYTKADLSNKEKDPLDLPEIDQPRDKEVRQEDSFGQEGKSEVKEKEAYVKDETVEPESPNQEKIHKPEDREDSKDTSEFKESKSDDAPTEVTVPVDKVVHESSPHTENAETVQDDIKSVESTNSSLVVKELVELLNVFNHEIKSGNVQNIPELIQKLKDFFKENTLTLKSIINELPAAELKLITEPLMQFFQNVFEKMKSLQGPQLPKKEIAKAFEFFEKFKSDIAPEVLKNTTSTQKPGVFEKLNLMVEKLHDAGMKIFQKAEAVIKPEVAPSLIDVTAKHINGSVSDQTKDATQVSPNETQNKKVDLNIHNVPVKEVGVNSPLSELKTDIVRHESVSEVSVQNLTTASHNSQQTVKPQDIQVNSSLQVLKTDVPTIVKAQDSPQSGLNDLKDQSKSNVFDSVFNSGSDKTVNGAIKENPKWLSYFSKAFNAEGSVMEKITAHFKLLKTGPDTNHMRFDLSPPELGKVRIELKNTGGVISGKIQVENIVVKEMVESNLNQLRQNIATDMKLDKLEVEVRQENKNTWQSMNADSEMNSQGKHQQKPDTQNKTHFGHYDWKDVEIPVWVPSGIYNVSGIIKVDVLG